MKKINTFKIPLMKIMTGTYQYGGWYVNKVTEKTYCCGDYDEEREMIKIRRNKAREPHNRTKDK